MSVSKTYAQKLNNCQRETRISEEIVEKVQIHSEIWNDSLVLSRCLIEMERRETYSMYSTYLEERV